MAQGVSLPRLQPVCWPALVQGGVQAPARGTWRQACRHLLGQVVEYGVSLSVASITRPRMLGVQLLIGEDLQQTIISTE